VSFAAAMHKRGVFVAVVSYVSGKRLTAFGSLLDIVKTKATL
jgi:hypothetical protein